MKKIYIRWGGLLLAGLIVAVLGVQRYERDVTTITPERLISEKPAGTVRVLGTVQAGTLEGTPPYNQAAFRLAGEAKSIVVRYEGQSADNLRELKTLVVEGQWDASSGEFKGRDVSLLPNYAFVVAAYLITIVPTGLFLFRMERKVEMLYNEIKTATVYEPEEASFDKG